MAEENDIFDNDIKPSTDIVFVNGKRSLLANGAVNTSSTNEYYKMARKRAPVADKLEVLARGIKACFDNPRTRWLVVEVNVDKTNKKKKAKSKRKSNSRRKSSTKSKHNGPRRWRVLDDEEILTKIKRTISGLRRDDGAIRDAWTANKEKKATGKVAEEKQKATVRDEKKTAAEKKKREEKKQSLIKDSIPFLNETEKKVRSITKNLRGSKSEGDGDTDTVKASTEQFLFQMNLQGLMEALKELEDEAAEEFETMSEIGEKVEDKESLTERDMLEYDQANDAIGEKAEQNNKLVGEIRNE